MNARTISLALSALAATASLSNAAIIGVSGNCVQIPAPPSALVGALASAKAWAWDEQTNITVGTGIYCDETQNPGGNLTPIPGILLGSFDSHIVHFDSIPGVVNAAGAVTFSQPIVGVIFLTTSLNNSDATCGALATTYPTGYPLRQFGSSSFSVFGNMLQFNLNSFASAPLLVEVRVLTHSVPAPASAALLGMGGLAAFRRRRA
jgi:hypothetical protein